MHVEQVMTRNVFACHPGDSLNRAAQIMWENDCGIVPVLGPDDRVTGVLTDRDICMAAYIGGMPLSDLQVCTASSNRIVACRPTDSIEAAEQHMREAQVRRLVVTDDSGRLVGVLSLSDLARQSGVFPMEKGSSFDPNSLSLTLEAVSRRRGVPAKQSKPELRPATAELHATPKPDTKLADGSGVARPTAVRVVRPGSPQGQK